MNAETLKALDESIDHWERLATGNRREDEDMTEHDCALCGLFFPSCRGCPVSEKTGAGGCYGSPFRDAIKAFKLNGNNYNSPEFKSAALKELEFLKSLRPVTP